MTNTVEFKIFMFGLIVAITMFAFGFYLASAIGASICH